MVEILNQSTSSCLVVRFIGKLTEDDFKVFRDELSSRQKSEKLSLVVELSDFEFYDDLNAAKNDFKFGIGEYRQVYRAAFVGDKKWTAWFTRLIGPFTRTEEKHFTTDQLENACKWVMM